MVRTQSHDCHERAPRSWSALWLFVAALGCQGTVDSEGVSPAEHGATPDTSPDPGTTPAPGTGNDPGTMPGPGGDPGSPGPVSCTTPSPGSAPLRRLSNAEYENTLSDLFSGVDGVSADIDAATRELPRGEYRGVLSGDAVEGGARPIAEILRRFPVELLRRVH